MKDRKLLFQNPVLLLALGCVPALAASTDLRAALGMSLAVMFVLLCSALVMGLLRKLLPAGARLPAAVLTVAGFAAMAQMLRLHNGNVSAAAKALGVSRNTIYRKKDQLPPGLLR